MLEETLHCIHFRSGQGLVFHDRQALAYDRQALAYDRQALAYDRQALAYDIQALAYDRQAQVCDRQALAYDRQALARDKQVQVCDMQVTFRNNELVGASHGENRDVSHDKNSDVSHGENSDMSLGVNHDGCKGHSIYCHYESHADHKEYSSLGYRCGSFRSHSGHSSHSDCLNQKMNPRYDKIQVHSDRNLALHHGDHKISCRDSHGHLQPPR